jgi:hypothetical protein
VTGIGAGEGLLGPVPCRLPLLRVAYEQQAGDHGRASIDDDHVVLTLGLGRAVVVERATNVPSYRRPRPPSAA